MTESRSQSKKKKKRNINSKGMKFVLSLSQVMGKMQSCQKKKGANRGKDWPLSLSCVELRAGRARGQDLGGVGDGSTRFFYRIFGGFLQWGVAMTNRAEISAFSSVIWEWGRRLGQGRCGGSEARSYLRNSPWVMRKEEGRIRP
jgi:hypothetical protein